MREKNHLRQKWRYILRIDYKSDIEMCLNEALKFFQLPKKKNKDTEYKIKNYLIVSNAQLYHKMTNHLVDLLNEV